MKINKISDLTEMNVALLNEDEKTIEAFDSAYGYESAKTPTTFIDDETVKIWEIFSVSKKMRACKKRTRDLQYLL